MSFFISFQAKVGMLDNLLDIEVAYSLLKSGEGDLAKDPLDVNYEKLQTDLEVNANANRDTQQTVSVNICLEDLLLPMIFGQKCDETNWSFL